MNRIDMTGINILDYRSDVLNLITDDKLVLLAPSDLDTMISAITTLGLRPIHSNKTNVTTILSLLGRANAIKIKLETATGFNWLALSVRQLWRSWKNTETLTEAHQAYAFTTLAFEGAQATELNCFKDVIQYDDNAVFYAGLVRAPEFTLGQLITQRNSLITQKDNLYERINDLETVRDHLATQGLIQRDFLSKLFNDRNDLVNLTLALGSEPSSPDEANEVEATAARHVIEDTHARLAAAEEALATLESALSNPEQASREISQLPQDVLHALEEARQNMVRETSILHQMTECLAKKRWQIHQFTASLSTAESELAIAEQEYLAAQKQYRTLVSQKTAYLTACRNQKAYNTYRENAALLIKSTSDKINEIRSVVINLEEMLYDRKEELIELDDLTRKKRDLVVFYQQRPRGLLEQHREQLVESQNHLNRQLEHNETILTHLLENAQHEYRSRHRAIERQQATNSYNISQTKQKIAELGDARAEKMDELSNVENELAHRDNELKEVSKKMNLASRFFSLAEENIIRVDENGSILPYQIHRLRLRQLRQIISQQHPHLLRTNSGVTQDIHSLLGDNVETLIVEEEAQPEAGAQPLPVVEGSEDGHWQHI